MQTLYTGHATVTGGREGKLVSSDGALDLPLRMPKELGGAGGAGTNPEQLFAGGYAACFESALNIVCRNKKVKVEGTKVTGHVSIGKDEGGFQLSAVLEVELMGIDKALAEEIVEEAHGVCPYSKMARKTINVETRVI